MADSVDSRRISGSETTPTYGIHATLHEAGTETHSEMRQNIIAAKPIDTVSSRPSDNDTTACTATRDHGPLVLGDHTPTYRGVQADGDFSDARGFNLGEYTKRVFSSSSNNVHDVDDILFTTATGKDDRSYCLSEGKKIAIIFNHEKYDPVRELSQRSGTESDVQLIDSTFKEIGFELHTYDDRTVDDIRRVFRNLQLCQEELACLAVFILTHGEENGILHAYDNPYRLDKEIINELLPERCPTLAGKPKLIFIQACQGKETDEGSVVTTRHRHTSTDGGIVGSNYRIPHYSDFLIFQVPTIFVRPLCPSFKSYNCNWTPELSDKFSITVLRCASMEHAL